MPAPPVRMAGISLATCVFGYTCTYAQVQNITAWTLDSFDSPDITVGGITYRNNYATPLTVTTSVGIYDAGTAGAGADDVFVRRNTATPTSTTNVQGQGAMFVSTSGGGSTVYGTYNPTMKDLLLGGNILNSTFDTFANSTSGTGYGYNIERIDFVWSGGYTVVGDEVIIVFNFDPISSQDDFRVAVFTGIDDTADKRPTSYANSGVLVTGTSYPDKLPLPISGSPTTTATTGFRTSGVDDLSGTALNLTSTGTHGVGGVAISLATLGISPGQTIFGYSLIPGDVNASSAANLVDFTNSSIYPTTTPDSDAAGTADFSTFGGRIATIQTGSSGGSFEWDNGAGTTAWGSSYTSGNSNWYSGVSGDNNLTPRRDADVLFGDKPSTNQIVDLSFSVEVRKMTFDADVNYTIGTAGDTPTITLGDPNLAGAPSIEIDSTYRDGLQHKINANLLLVENLEINNNTNGTTLCINGYIETKSTLSPRGNTITVNGTGPVNFNGDISGSGDLVKNGRGIATINNNNSDDPANAPTQWIGNVLVNDGQLVITADGALGGSVNRNTNAASSSGSTIQLPNASATDLKVGQLVTGTNIPADTYITAISIGGSNTTITLSNAVTGGGVASNAPITFAGATTVTGPGTLTLRSTQTGTAGNYTETALNYTVAETITIGGTGSTRLPADNTGAIYNDGGNNTLGANVTLRLTGGGATINSRDDNLTINGVIREASAGQFLAKTGEGVVTLTNSGNSYTGPTLIANGALRIATNETALPGGFATGGASGGNLILGGGVLEIGQNAAGTATLGTFTRQVGSAADQVQWNGDGGFSAYGSNATVTLGSSLVWGANSFVPTGNALLLSSKYSNATVTLTNDINLGSAQREVRVANGSAAVDGVLSGVLSGTGGIVKTGAGTLDVGTGNTYSGATEIKAGALRGTVSSSNLQLNGGAREITASATIGLGVGAAQVQWTGNGGFAAYTNDSTLTLDVVGNANDDLTWGSTGSFVGASNTLSFGSVSANKTLTLANNISLGASGTRSIQTIQGTASVANGTLSGVLSGAANLSVGGNGRLDLTAANTNNGALAVAGAEVRLTGANGAMASVSGITLKQGGVLSIDHTSDSINSPDRLADTAAINLEGGTLNLYGRTGNHDTVETVGTVTLASGANTINAGYGDSSGSAQLTLSGLSRTSGATVNFTNVTIAGASAGTLGNTADASRILVTGLGNTGGIVGGWATVGDNWATEINDARGIGALTTYETGNVGNWGTTENISIATNRTNNADRTVNSLKLNGAGGARTLDLDNDGTNRALTVTSGGILSTGNVTNIIRADNAGSVIRAGGASDLVVHTQNTGTNVNTLQINARIADNSGGNGLTKAGDGTLELGGSMANTYTGVTTVNAGTVILNKTAGVNAIAGDGNTGTNDVIVGDGRGVDILRLGGNEQIANNAQVLLRGGEVGNAANVARLELNGATDNNTASRIETFHTLSVTGNSVLDFGGGTVCSPTYLYLDVLSVAVGSVLTITDWIESTDFLLVDRDTFDQSQLPRIVFEGYSGTARWQVYDGNYYQITPVPEPASYGALAVGGLVAFSLARRRRRVG